MISPTLKQLSLISVAQRLANVMMESFCKRNFFGVDLSPGQDPKNPVIDERTMRPKLEAVVETLPLPISGLKPEILFWLMKMYNQWHKLDVCVCLYTDVCMCKKVELTFDIYGVLEAEEIYEQYFDGVRFKLAPTEDAIE